MAKRVFDIVVASLTLLAALPVLAVAALAIRLASPGPVLHRAARAGRDGRPFTMLKLRTMHVAPPGESGSRITDPADPRVFPVGALLRRTKIDELPQLVNVLRGEMAIVGPRPEDPEIVRKHYSPTHRETLRVRPGLVSPGSITTSRTGTRCSGPATRRRRTRHGCCRSSSSWSASTSATRRSATTSP